MFFLQLPGVLWASSRNPSLKLGENRLLPLFTNLVVGGATDADIAQRITTLLNYVRF